MSHKKECIVIIPVYKALDDIDKASIRQAVKMTHGTDITFIMPNSFKLDDSFNEFKDIGIERFDNSYFANILGYNKLMLDVTFYKRFISYKYMLIHQTDVFLFKDELQYWCSRGYDYIGAPWLYPKKLIKSPYHNFVLNKCPWIMSHRRIINGTIINYNYF